MPYLSVHQPHESEVYFSLSTAPFGVVYLLVLAIVLDVVGGFDKRLAPLLVYGPVLLLMIFAAILYNFTA